MRPRNVFSKSPATNIMKKTIADQKMPYFFCLKTQTPLNMAKKAFQTRQTFKNIQSQSVITGFEFIVSFLQEYD